MSSLVSIPSGSTDLRQIVFGVNQALQQWGATGPSSGLLQAANNLSDVASASISLANLGITTGTSGHVVPFLDGINSFSAAQAFKAPVTGYEINGFGYIAPGVNGVVGNGSTDDTTAIQAILNAYSNIYIDAGKYLISATLTITLGNPSRIIQGAGSQASNGSGIKTGAFFIAAASFTGTAAILISSTAGNAAKYAIGGFSITNTTAGSGASYGLSISGPGGGTKNSIYDVVSSGFAFNFLVQNTRMLVWERCAAWQFDLAGSVTTGGFGWYLLGNGGSNFVGDMDFESCQTVVDGTGTGIVMTDQGTASSLISGIRFRNHTHYYGSFGINMGLTGANSGIHDIWVHPGCQFEGQLTPAYGVMINMKSAASSASILDIHIDGVYGSGNGWAQHVVGIASSSGLIRFVFVINNWFANPQTSGTVYFLGTGADCRGITVANNQIEAPAAMGAGGIGIYIADTLQAAVTGNSFVGTGSQVAWLVQFNGSGGQYLTAAGNNGGGLCSNVPCVDNATGNVTIAIGNNY